MSYNMPRRAHCVFHLPTQASAFLSVFYVSMPRRAHFVFHQSKC